MKICYSNKKFIVLIKTRMTQIKINIFVNEKPVFKGILKINYLSALHGRALVCITRY